MSLKLKVPPLVVFATALFIMWGINQLWPIYLISYSIRMWGTIIMLLLASATGFWAVTIFFQNSTTINPHKPKKAAKLITSGIYQYSRNPMYLGLLLSLIAVIIYFRNRLTFTIWYRFAAYMTYFQIQHAEQIMRLKFGAAYLLYQLGVPRWI